MRRPLCRGLIVIILITAVGEGAAAAEASGTLSGTTLLTGDIDPSEQMRADIERYLDRALEQAVARRSSAWARNFMNQEAYERSVAENRVRFAKLIGAVDRRVEKPVLHTVSTVGGPNVLGRSPNFTGHAVRWSVYDDVEAEGILLQPTGQVRARIVALPDADQTPEMIAGLVDGLALNAQFARRLAENGCQVLIPTLVDRSDTHSGSQMLNRFTNQTHREWIYRQAYTLGRHIIGYEVHQVMSAIDWFTQQENSAPIGVIGWGEGGLIALYSGALDTRINATFVSGYFGPREQLWSEPMYRNCFGLLSEFGDAEIASLIVPRTLIVDSAAGPKVEGPPPTRPGRRATAALGKIVTPAPDTVRAEVERAREMVKPFAAAIRLVPASHVPVGETAVHEFLRALSPSAGVFRDGGPTSVSAAARLTVDRIAERQRRLVATLEAHTQPLIARTREVRDNTFWKPTPITTPEAWDRAMEPKRAAFWNEIIGRLPKSETPLNVRSRVLYDRDDSVGYEILLDALPDVTLWGYLLVPKNLSVDERRPLVVAQHGLSGLPESMIDENREGRPYRVYKALALQLVRRGYAVFVPHFPWRTREDYHRLQRKANPLGLSHFSFILAHHTRLLDWLETLPFVDAKRVAYYGLSWGGKVGMRVPALEKRYALSIVSGDFNEWIWKNATTAWPNSYMFAPEPDMFDFNLGPMFGYAEMAAMIAPRPFMVERGHDDGVGIDEMVAFEYARVNRLYSKLRIPERTTIEYFNGVHEIHGVGTFQFLQRHLNWPPISDAKL